MECQVKDIAVHYETFGDGIPILMLHGWSLSGRQMQITMEPIFSQRQGWRRIYPDLPGHGQTPGKAWVTDQDKLLEVVLDFIDEIIPGQRFVVAGASAGAYLARGVALGKGALLDGLLLTVPMIEAADAKRKLPAHVAVVKDPALMGELDPEEAASFGELAVVQRRDVLDAYRAFSPTPEEAGDPEFQARIREHPEKYAYSFDIDAISKPIGAPTLIIAGRQDSVVGYRQAWELLENYPRGTFVVLDRAGHMLELEQEKIFGALVTEWLDRVAEYAAEAG